jgi:putative redox protein
MGEFTMEHKGVQTGVLMTGVYQGEKHCELIHGPSGSRIETDAPKDNHGKGEKFSPTDLVGAALGSCIVTTMAILTEKEGIDLMGANFEVRKIMGSNPRRISEFVISLNLPLKLSPEERTRLQAIAQNCPVQLSLHPELKVSHHFNYILPDPS